MSAALGEAEGPKFSGGGKEGVLRERRISDPSDVDMACAVLRA